MIPRRLRKGEPLTANWVNALRDEVQAQRVSTGPGLKMVRTSAGTMLSGAPMAESVNIPRVAVGDWVAVVSSSPPKIIGQRQSGEEVHVFLTAWPLSQRVAAGTRVIGFNIETYIVGGDVASGGDGEEDD